MIYVVLDKRDLKCIGSYQADHVTIKDPFTDPINQMHYEVEEGKYPEGYYLKDDLTVEYNFNYQPPESTAESLTESKLLSIIEYYKTESAKFAAQNSVLMAIAGYTAEQKALFVAGAVRDFKPIKDEVEMFSFYSIWSMFDLIERNEILTEERILSLKGGLYSFINGE